MILVGLIGILMWQILGWLYKYRRTVQNMSFFHLPGNTILRLPDYPNLEQTLLLIQTHRYCPLNSTVSLDQNMAGRASQPQDEELSLDLKINNANNQTINSAATIKKKKTGCTCKKTKCLKMYCECFSSGKMCNQDCNCFGCSNCEEFMGLVDKAKEMVKMKISVSAKNNNGKGCNCKKSQCQKKYCECFNAGLSCGIDCKCEDCLNGSCSSHGEQKMEKNEGKLQLDYDLVSSLMDC